MKKIKITRVAYLAFLAWLNVPFAGAISDLERACDRKNKVSTKAGDLVQDASHKLSSDKAKEADNLPDTQALRSGDNAIIYQGGEYSWGWVKKKGETKLVDVPASGKMLLINFDPTDYLEEDHNKNHAWLKRDLLFIRNKDTLKLYASHRLIEKPTGLIKYKKPAVTIDTSRAAWNLAAEVKGIDDRDSMFVSLNPNGSATVTFRYTKEDKETCHTTFIPKSF